MANPRVFVSSTCYDLKYIRENLKYFIKNLGYEPILSEEGDIYYNTLQHTHEACVKEVHNAQMFVLIIGGRYGSNYMDTKKSITNKEYEEAQSSNIPIFTLIERNVYNEYHVYLENKSINGISYPSVDNIKIFEFIDSVRKNNKNNALCPFDDFNDIEIYLKKQWAGMLYSFLTDSSEKEKVAKLFESIDTATQKIEYYTKQMITNSNSDMIKLQVQLYDMMINTEISQTLRYWRIKISPQKILQHDSLDDICNNNILVENAEYSIVSGGPPYKISPHKYEESKIQYIDLREKMIERIRENNLGIEDFATENNEE